MACFLRALPPDIPPSCLPLSPSASLFFPSPFPFPSRVPMAGTSRGWWRHKREDLASQPRHAPSFPIPSPVEDRDAQQTIAELRVARAKHCTDEGVKAGFKAASIACVATAVPTLTAVRMVPWVKAHLNYTGQALVISAATIAAYFIVVDQTILECSRKESWDALEKRRSEAS